MEWKLCTFKVVEEPSFSLSVCLCFAPIGFKSIMLYWNHSIKSSIWAYIWNGDSERYKSLPHEFLVDRRRMHKHLFQFIRICVSAYVFFSFFDCSRCPGVDFNFGGAFLFRHSFVLTNLGNVIQRQKNVSEMTVNVWIKVNFCSCRFTE